MPADNLNKPKITEQKQKLPAFLFLNRESDAKLTERLGESDKTVAVPASLEALQGQAV